MGALTAMGALTEIAVNADRRGLWTLQIILLSVNEARRISDITAQADGEFLCGGIKGSIIAADHFRNREISRFIWELYHLCDRFSRRLKRFVNIPKRASTAKLTEMKAASREPFRYIPCYIYADKEKGNTPRIGLLQRR